MTDDTVTSVDNGDDLAQFEAEFLGTAKPAEPVEIEEVADLGEEDSDPPAADEDDEQDGAEAELESDEDEAEDEKPKKNKVPANKRIEQLNKQLRETEREYERRIAQLEAAINGKAKEEQTPLREQLPSTAPDPDAKLENGDAKYPLGEFDKQYIADLTQHTIEERMEAAKQQMALEQRQQEIQQEREQLSNQWIERLDKAEESIPEIRENIQELTNTFDNIDPGYGEYLAATLMSLDNGPELMNYLSQNIGEAQKIVNLGPALATFELGRLSAAIAPQKEPTKAKKVSKAPPPPDTRVRGSNGKFAVRGDTDNLDAFEEAFFNL